MTEGTSAELKAAMNTILRHAEQDAYDRVNATVREIRRLVEDYGNKERLAGIEQGKRRQPDDSTVAQTEWILSGQLAGLHLAALHLEWIAAGVEPKLTVHDNQKADLERMRAAVEKIRGDKANVISKEETAEWLEGFIGKILSGNTTGMGYPLEFENAVASIMQLLEHVRIKANRDGINKGFTAASIRVMQLADREAFVTPQEQSKDMERIRAAVEKIREQARQKGHDDRVKLREALSEADFERGYQKGFTDGFGKGKAVVTL
jgi:hypothetical protein